MNENEEIKESNEEIKDKENLDSDNEIVVSEMVEGELKENPFKSKDFYIAFLLSLGIPILMTVFATLVINEYSFIFYLFAIIPYAIIGVFLWLGLRKTNRPRALGLMFGCSTPFIGIFILSGGCGLLHI